MNEVNFQVDREPSEGPLERPQMAWCGQYPPVGFSEGTWFS